jgi:hypothetical protein
MTAARSVGDTPVNCTEKETFINPMCGADENVAVAEAVTEGDVECVPDALTENELHAEALRE